MARRVFIPTFWGPDYPNAPGRLACPECASPDIEQGEFDENSDDAVTFEPDRDEYVSPIGTRGGYVDIQLRCANCRCAFSFVVGNHKGAQCVGLVVKD